MIQVDEIAPDVFRISLYAPNFELTFNHFLVRDDEPLLFHAGLRGMFPQIRDAVGRLIDPATIRYVGFSHFESDECGALNQWLDLAPRSEPLCGLVGALYQPPKSLTLLGIPESARLRFSALSANW